MTLVPALMSLLGNRVYWLPRWLQRVLPDLDVEGSNLSKSLETVPETSFSRPTQNKEEQHVR